MYLGLLWISHRRFTNHLWEAVSGAFAIPAIEGPQMQGTEHVALRSKQGTLGILWLLFPVIRVAYIMNMPRIELTL